MDSAYDGDARTMSDFHEFTLGMILTWRANLSQSSKAGDASPVPFSGDTSVAHGGQGPETVPVTAYDTAFVRDNIPTSLPQQSSFISSDHAERQRDPPQQREHQPIHPEVPAVFGSETPSPTVTPSSKAVFSCTYRGCSLRFETVTLLHEHKHEVHRQDHRGPKGWKAQSGPHVCTQIHPKTLKPCNESFGRPEAITRHERTTHDPNRKKVSCPECGTHKQFCRWDALQEHYRNIHRELPVPGKDGAMDCPDAGVPIDSPVVGLSMDFPDTGLPTDFTESGLGMDFPDAGAPMDFADTADASLFPQISDVSIAPITQGNGPTAINAGGVAYFTTDLFASVLRQTAAINEEYHEAPQQQQHQSHGQSNQDPQPLPLVDARPAKSQSRRFICHKIDPRTNEPCAKDYSRQSVLSRHEKKVHQAEKTRVPCTVCTDKERTFCHRDALATHYKRFHPGLPLPLPPPKPPKTLKTLKTPKAKNGAGDSELSPIMLD